MIIWNIALFYFSNVVLIDFYALQYNILKFLHSYNPIFGREF